MSSPTNLQHRDRPPELPAPGPQGRPTNVRFAVLWVTTIVSFLMYLDRSCVSEVGKLDTFMEELQLSRQQVGDVLGAFFFAYALFQVPAGWLSDRFGARSMMTFYVVLWSAFTALTGLAGGLLGLLIARLGCGIAQAGAYPTSGGLLSRWIPLTWRGMASSIVAFGGRIGFAAAGGLTLIAIQQLGGWRQALAFYGAAGLAIAFWFWHVFRESPEDHPGVNAAELELIRRDRPPVTRQARGKADKIPLRAIASSPSLWCLSISMFFTNVGWAFLITWMPTYFAQVQQLPEEESAQLKFVALLGGPIGLVLGGWVTDVATRRFGLRWGRSGPLVISRMVGMLAYLACLKFDSPWAVTAAFFVVGFSTDIGIGGSWAFTQDVGGRHVGSILGWANMWGNFGAMLVSMVMPRVVDMEHATDWDEAFLFCAAGFLVSGLASLGINATVPIVAKEQPSSEVESAGS